MYVECMSAGVAVTAKKLRERKKKGEALEERVSRLRQEVEELKKQLLERD